MVHMKSLILNGPVTFSDYIRHLATTIPILLYLFFFTIAIVVVAYIIFDRRNHNQNSRNNILLLFMAVYYIIVLSFTVFCRNATHPSGYNYTPFWSYYMYFSNRAYYTMLYENIMNIIVFIPFGIIARLLGRQPVIKVLLFGFVPSLTIELQQLLFNKGFSEFDDIMHNTIGCILGYYLSLYSMKILNKNIL